MLRHFLTNDIVIRNEPQLVDYLRSNETDYNNIIEEAEEELLTDLVNMNYDITKICKKLEIINEPSICNSSELYTGIWSEIDYAKRFRLFLSVFGMRTIEENHPYSVTIKIDGTNSESESPASDEIFNVLTKTYNTEPADGEYSYTLPSLFKRYRFSVTAIFNDDDSLAVDVYLIENVYTELMKLKVRAKIYFSIRKEDYDQWSSKFTYYSEEYSKLLKNGNYYVDVDESGQIEEGEGESPNDNIMLVV